MAENVNLSQLSATLNFFNESLNKSNKLDEKALKTIQQYLNNPQVRVSNQEDGDRVQHTLEHLQKLRESTILARVSSATIDKINRQLKNLEQLILENSNQMIGDAYFIIVNLEVCFLDILSDETENSNKYWQKTFEEKMMRNEKFPSVPDALHSKASYMDRQQRLINELMNAPLFNVIEYFEQKQQKFDSYFTQKFLDKLNEKCKNPNYVLPNTISIDVFNILSKTAKQCNLPMTDLIYHLRYAIIDMDNQMYQYVDLLEKYIRETESRTLMGFNNLIPSSWALSSKEVKQFSGLFDLYCEILLFPTDDISENRGVESTSDAQPLNVSELEPTTCSMEPTIQIKLSSPPPISLETDVKFVWIEPNVESYYDAYRDTISPASIIHYNSTEILSKIPNDWIHSRIFLCLSVKETQKILPHIHRAIQPYRVYVLCNEKSEENTFSRNDEVYGKIQLITSDENIFIQQLSIDIIPSFIEIGDLYLKTNEYVEAQRWFQLALDKINEYDKSKEKLLVPFIEKRLKQCSR